VAAAVGPVVAPAAAQNSLRWARRALELIQRGLLADERPTFVTDHLSDLILLHDEGLAQLLIGERLAPIRELGAGERQRLLETLEAWLSHQRQTPAVAAQLHVHPQTVRYRMSKLRELLGDALEDAEQRFELEAAVRAWRRFGALATGPDG
jgi:DNA-binding PucR family transcriptional regulator